jgi:hypothetical protein
MKSDTSQAKHKAISPKFLQLLYKVSLLVTARELRWINHD